MPRILQAGLWGLVAGSALLVGAAVGYLTTLPQRLITAVMAFGGGVLISALSFELMDEAYQRGGFTATGIGFLGGAVIYSAANLYLARRGASTASAPTASSLAIAVGALLDGIPESIVIGVTMIGGRCRRGGGGGHLHLQHPRGAVQLGRDEKGQALTRLHLRAVGHDCRHLRGWPH
jgi:ZIP family zinc transporter